MAAGLSRQALAERCGCSMSYIAQIESGLTPGYSSVLPRLERALQEIEDEHGTLNGNGVSASEAGR
jgi:transcriptional regulator with XRE-family HTH domain